MPLNFDVTGVDGIFDSLFKSELRFNELSITNMDFGGVVNIMIYTLMVNKSSGGGARIFHLTPLILGYLVSIDRAQSSALRCYVKSSVVTFFFLQINLSRVSPVAKLCIHLYLSVFAGFMSYASAFWFGWK